MTKQQKAKKILLLLTLFSLSLLIVAPLASNALAYSNNTRLLPTTISAAQTPGSISTGKTWTYKFTYRNSTFTGSFTYTQQNSGVEYVADWNNSIQTCYKLTTTIDVIQFWTALGSPSILSDTENITSDTLILSLYIKTTDYSIIEMETLEVCGYKNGTGSQTFWRYFFDIPVSLYEFPLSNGQNWQNNAFPMTSGLKVYTTGNNETYSPTLVPFSVTASVSGPALVTVPAGTYWSYQINNTGALFLLFGLLGFLPLSIGLTSWQFWYSYDAQNFIKGFLNYSSGENVTVELLPISNLLQTMLFLTFYNAQQEQSFSKLLLIGGGIGAVIIIAGIAIAIHRRRG